ncbi:perforin-1-like [Echeneis naucrates]|uniref:Perforin-1-like n=1 Tax=Echeneis naucrates TaxID=173247 RepID=A0A665TSM4_ECHNA|nr:perforin-1-like [Echeneis naucrates]
MASGLPFFLLVLCCLTRIGAQLKVFDLRASNLPSDILGITDGYVKVFSGSVSLGMTAVRNNDANPWWDEVFFHSEAQENEILTLEVHDRDLVFDDLLGVCKTQIKIGTHQHDCLLEEGGNLHFAYTLNGNGQ